MSEHHALPAADLCLESGATHPIPLALTIPGQSEVRAAWLALPAETRDRIGVLAVEHIFGMFLAAENDFADSQTFRLDLAGQVAGEHRASDALTEVALVVPEALPELFGRMGENPAWTTRQEQAR